MKSEAQNQGQSLNYRIDVTKFDFFTGIEYSRCYKSYHPYSALEIGINRSIFQQRFYPKFTLGISYDLLKNEKVLVGPTAHYAYSILKVNKASEHFHHWNELMGGIRLELGSKLKYIFQTEYGWIAETYFNQISQKNNTVHSHGYVISMGLGYAW